jgi:hypothetical protein
MERYKKALLVNVDEKDINGEKPEVEIEKIELVCPDRPKGNITMDFAHHDPKVVRNFTVKEASLYCMRVHFKVRNDIVFGLNFVNNVYKLFIKSMCALIQWVRMKTKWAVLFRSERRMSLIFRGCRRLQDSLRVEIIRARLW